MKHTRQARTESTSARAGLTSAPTGQHAEAAADNRPISTVQRKLQQAANDSPLANDTLQLQAAGDAFSEQEALPVQRKANTTGMPDNLKSGIENLSGYSMDDVKVHYNSDKPEGLQAHAYAQGTDIHVAPGQEKHLPHEAWHVVQQKQGRVKPTRQLKGKTPVNDDQGLEKEADAMGAKALQLKAGPGRDLKRPGGIAPVFQLRKRAATTEQWNRELTKRKKMAIANQKLLNKFVNYGLNARPRKLKKGQTADENTLFRNTCEAIRDGKIFISALTPTLSCDWTHPNHTDGWIGSFFWERTLKEAMEGQLFFDPTVIYPSTGVPDDEAAEGLVINSKNNFVRRQNEPAHSSGKEMRVFFRANEPYDFETLKSILIHESQHSLDHHDARQQSNWAAPSMDDSRNTPGVGDVANRYQTEFRAYWLGDNPNGGSFGSATKKAKNKRTVQMGIPIDPIHDDPMEVETHFKNERQENIFWYLVDHSYKWAGTNYFDSEAFRTMVDNFDRPVGGNLLNSARIESLFTALSSAKTQIAQAKTAGAENRIDDGLDLLETCRTRLLATAGNLNFNDRFFLKDGVQSAPFWSFFNQVLAPLGYEALDTYQQETLNAVRAEIFRKL